MASPGTSEVRCSEIKEILRPSRPKVELRKHNVVLFSNKAQVGSFATRLAAGQILLKYAYQIVERSQSEKLRVICVPEVPAYGAGDGQPFRALGSCPSYKPA